MEEGVWECVISRAVMWRFEGGMSQRSVLVRLVGWWWWWERWEGLTRRGLQEAFLDLED